MNRMTVVMLLLTGAILLLTAAEAGLIIDSLF